MPKLDDKEDKQDKQDNNEDEQYTVVVSNNENLELDDEKTKMPQKTQSRFGGERTLIDDDMKSMIKHGNQITPLEGNQSQDTFGSNTSQDWDDDTNDGDKRHVHFASLPNNNQNNNNLNVISKRDNKSNKESRIPHDKAREHTDTPYPFGKDIPGFYSNPSDDNTLSNIPEDISVSIQHVHNAGTLTTQDGGNINMLTEHIKDQNIINVNNNNGDNVETLTGDINQNISVNNTNDDNEGTLIGDIRQNDNSETEMTGVKSCCCIIS